MTVALAQTSPFMLSDHVVVGWSSEARKIRQTQGDAFLHFQQGRALPLHLTALSSEARVAVDARWPDVSEAMFDYLALHFPMELLSLVSSEVLAPPTLTFAAEIAGKVSDSQAVRAALVPLLDHESALVREGAIYGLRDHIDATVAKKVRALAKHDPSPGVRQAASDTLDDK